MDSSRSVNVVRRIRGVVTAAAAVMMALPAMASGNAEKVLRIPMTTSGPNSLDPVRGSTTYENRCCVQVYETLLTYHYLKRPLELEPLLLERMPEVSDDGLVWDFKLKEGVTFHDDACFPGGEGRELVADDVIYSWKRLADPKYEYKNWWLVENYIKGFDEYKESQAARVEDGEAFDYGAEVEGLKATGKYTFRVILNEPLQPFAYRLAMFQFSIVPREAVEYYGDRFDANPVGTGPFILEEESDWVRNSNITFTRNPEYREARYPEEWMPGDEEFGFHEAAGEQVPFVDKLEFTFFIERQPMWLQFKAGNLDFTTVPADQFYEAFSRRTKELRFSWKRRGVAYHPVPLLDFIFRGFNMDDPLLGGLTPEKRALRQAISLAMNFEEVNEARYNGTAVIYDGPIPPGLAGHPEGHRTEPSYIGPDYERAREKLEEAGYTIGADGTVQDLPIIDLWTNTGTESEKIVEINRRSLSRVGIEINPQYVNFGTLIDAVNNRRAPMFSFAWSSDYPDAENNLALFYSENVSPGSNHYNYVNPEYDKLYEQIKKMEPGPERTEIIVKMRDMIIRDTPYAGSMGRVRHYLVNPWLKNFKPTERFFSYFKYLDIDVEHEDRGG
mgnify:CR=1 FL=1